MYHAYKIVCDMGMGFFCSVVLSVSYSTGIVPK
ncbi:hypothetical protein CF65_01207 [Aggregatibacter actinomycetemcomitans HK1651]|nr:hypothetical protein CF65_01207 [Aggregatibacter actinomycetemcomitans HK1651]